MTPYIHHYLVAGVEGNARVFAHLLRDLAPTDARWDARPDPERFSLREVVAHLVEFDTVMRERFERMIREKLPDMPNWDEGEAATHYANRDPQNQLKNLDVSRRELGAWLNGLSANEWKRRGNREGVGEFSVEEGTALLLAHDSYHLEQVTAWLDTTR